MPPQVGTAGLGTASGAIRIDTADLRAVQATARQVGQDVSKSLGSIDAGVKRAESSFSGLGTAMTALGSIAGVTFGAVAVRQMMQFTLAADQVATSYDRQMVAARNLAGSQYQLNSLLAAYDKATGGAIDRASALGDVVSLQAIGFGKTAEQLERFVRAARGISIATGRPQDYVVQQLQLAIANQSLMRLDQIGLGVAEVQARIDALRASNAGLTKEMAYQQAILGIAEEKFGRLADSAEAQATGAEKAAKAWKDLKLAFGEFAGPAVGGMMGGLATELNSLSQTFKDLQSDIDGAKAALDRWNGKPVRDKSGQVKGAGAGSGIPRFGEPGFNYLEWAWSGKGGATWTDVWNELQRQRTMQPQRSRTGIGANVREGVFAPTPTPTTAGFSEEVRSAQLDYYRSVAQLDRQAAQQRLDATQQYEAQRTQTIWDYEQSIARDAADFARARARADADYARQVADVQEEAARREAEQRADLSERLAEIDEDYQRKRERAARDHSDRLLDAAARLDARAVAEEQRRYAREQEEAKDAHDEQVDKTQQAYDEQLAAGRDADARRLADMQEAFDRQRAQEDEDRALRLERQAQDHADQLTQMDVEQAQRLAQISRQAGEERAQLDEEFAAQLAQLRLHNEAWLKAQKAQQDAATKLFNQMWSDWTLTMVNAQQAVGAGRVFAGDYPRLGVPSTWLGNQPAGPPAPAASTGGRSVAVTMQPGAITIYGAIGQSETEIGRIVDQRLLAFFNSLNH